MLVLLQKGAIKNKNRNPFVYERQRSLHKQKVSVVTYYREHVFPTVLAVYVQF